VKIRPMTSGDYDSVYALWLSCSGMGLNSIDDSREGIAKFLRRNSCTCFAAEEGNAITGVIMAGHDGRRGYIYHTAVHPGFRGKGVGTLLVDAALDALKKEGITKVALVAFEKNIGGNAFWEKQGFTVRDDLVYRNRTLVEMERIDT